LIVGIDFALPLAGRAGLVFINSKRLVPPVAWTAAPAAMATTAAVRRDANDRAEGAKGSLRGGPELAVAGATYVSVSNRQDSV